MSLLLFFIDGIGVQHDDSLPNGIEGLFSEAMNPFALTDLAVGKPLYFVKGGAAAVDAVLGVEGLPQSATGQACIFTGVNAQQFLGFHQTAIPGDRLAALVQEKSLMKELKRRGISVTSANLYSQSFFESRRGGRKNRFPVSTLTISAADVPFRFADDYFRGEAVFADITNTLLVKQDWDIEEISPVRAAENMNRILEGSRFVFFEYFMTDLFAHKKNSLALKKEVDKLNLFLNTLLETGSHDILVVSDHGNAEDLDCGFHTDNPVPVIFFTKDRKKQEKFLAGLERIDQIYGRVLDFFS